MFLNKLSDVPVYEQLIRETEREIICGILRETEQIPSVRELAVSLGVNPNTIQKAYLELARREEIVASPGNGYFVAPGALERVRRHELERARTLAGELCSSGIMLEEVIEAVCAAYGSKGGKHD